MSGYRLWKQDRTLGGHAHARHCRNQYREAPGPPRPRRGADRPPAEDRGVHRSLPRRARLPAVDARDRRCRGPVQYLVRRLPAPGSGEEGRAASGPNRPRAYVLADSRTEASPAVVAHVPLVGRIAAGTPILAEEMVEDVLTFPRHVVGDGELFALKVVGESMAARPSATETW
jgi:hypothetical protein